MSTRDKIGLAVLLGLIAVFIGLLAITVKPHSNQRRNFENNIFVEQRMINVKKGQ